MARKRPDRNGVPPIFLPPALEQELGAAANDLLHALALPPPVSVRYEPSKPLTRLGAPVPWCATGRYLPERPKFTLDPALHAGAYYVQEASSMLVEQAFRAIGHSASAPLAVDLCAAPGGKSTHLASLLPPGALLISNEPVPTRQAALVENLRKQGYPNVVITGDRPERLSATLGGRCDLVLVDAPCSGEGMFRKEPFARQQWSERLVTACSRTQSEIAARAWEMVAPGGHLIYSTCTWERAENEEQVQKLVERGAEHIPLSLDPAWGIVESAWGNRCYPHRLQGEGFFVALLRKPGTPAGHGTATELDAMPAFAAPLLDPTHTMRTVIIEDELFAVPTAWSGLVAQLLHAARVLAPGVPVMERKGDRWRPHAALALNQRCNTRVFRSVELDQAGALAYLRGETAPLQAVPVTTPDEALLVRHRGLALGWAHAAGHRWNNGWPNAWRIRMR